MVQQCEVEVKVSSQLLNKENEVLESKWCKGPDPYVRLIHCIVDQNNIKYIPFINMSWIQDKGL
jgi:hypothetical protein